MDSSGNSGNFSVIQQGLPVSRASIRESGGESGHPGCLGRVDAGPKENAPHGLRACGASEPHGGLVTPARLPKTPCHVHQNRPSVQDAGVGPPALRLAGHPCITRPVGQPPRAAHLRDMLDAFARASVGLVADPSPPAAWSAETAVSCRTSRAGSWTRSVQCHLAPTPAPPCRPRRKDRSACRFPSRRSAGTRDVRRNS